jgi:leucyl aminopeptidase
MNITLESRTPAAIETHALVTYVFDEEPVSGRAGELGPASEVLRRLAQNSELTGKALEMTYLHAPQGLKAERLLVVGAGKKAKFDSAQLRKLAQTALRYLKSRGVKRLVFLAHADGATPQAAQAITEGLILGDCEGDK